MLPPDGLFGFEKRPAPPCGVVVCVAGCCVNEEVVVVAAAGLPKLNVGAVPDCGCEEPPVLAPNILPAGGCPAGVVELVLPKIVLDGAGAGVVEPNRLAVAGGWAGVPGVCCEPPPKPVKPVNAGLLASALLSSVLLPNRLPDDAPPAPKRLEVFGWLSVPAAGVGVCPKAHPDDPALLPNRLFPSFFAPAEPNRPPVVPADVPGVLLKLNPDIVPYVYTVRVQCLDGELVERLQHDG